MEKLMDFFRDKIAIEGSTIHRSYQKKSLPKNNEIKDYLTIASGSTRNFDDRATRESAILTCRFKKKNGTSRNFA